jgi:hypothetical protein
MYYHHHCFGFSDGLFFFVVLDALYFDGLFFFVVVLDALFFFVVVLDGLFFDAFFSFFPAYLFLLFVSPPL